MRDELDELDARLDIGLTYDEYGDHVGDISVASNRLDIDDLTAEGPLCLGVALKMNEAFLEYIDALEIWQNCIERSGCKTSSIETQMQGHWTTASDKLREVGKQFP